MSNKDLTSAELEVTQKIQMHFPRGLSAKTLGLINGCPVNELTEALRAMIENIGTKCQKVMSKFKSIVASFTVATVDKIKVSDCFTDKIWVYRDGDWDRWLTKLTPATPAGKPAVYELTENGPTVKGMAQFVLGTTEYDIAKLAKALVANGKTFSPKQVDDLVIRFVKGEKAIGLNDNSYANLFFVHDDDGNVFVAGVGLGSGGWCVGVYRLDSDSGWNAGRRFFTRN